MAAMLSNRICLYTTLAILVIDSIGSTNTETTLNAEKQVSLLRVAVPEEETELAPNPPADGYSSRHLRAIFDWPDKTFCHYKFRVEAVTTVEASKDRRTSRHFLKVGLDHHPLDILELPDHDSFRTDDVKLGRFVLSQTVWSCDRLRLEYRMAGDGCRARDYRKVKIFSSEFEGDDEIIVEDWWWQATDEECDDHQVMLL